MRCPRPTTRASGRDRAAPRQVALLDAATRELTAALAARELAAVAGRPQAERATLHAAGLALAARNSSALSNPSATMQ